MNPQNMVLALLGQGMTEKCLAEMVETNQPTIHRIKRGAGCKYQLGKRLEALCIERNLYVAVNPDMAA